MNIKQNTVKSKYNLTKPYNNPVVTKNLDNSLSLSLSSSRADIHIYKILNISRYIDIFKDETEINIIGISKIKQHA